MNTSRIIAGSIIVSLIYLNAFAQDAPNKYSDRATEKWNADQQVIKAKQVQSNNANAIEQNPARFTESETYLVHPDLLITNNFSYAISGILQYSNEEMTPIAVPGNSTLKIERNEDCIFITDTKNPLCISILKKEIHYYLYYDSATRCYVAK